MEGWRERDGEGKERERGREGGWYGGREGGREGEREGGREKRRETENNGEKQSACHLYKTVNTSTTRFYHRIIAYDGKHV